MIETLQQSRYLISRDRPARLYAVMAMAVAASVLEMLGAVLIVVFVGAIAGQQGSFSLPLLGDIQRFVPGIADETFLVVMAVLLAFFMVVRASVQLAFQYVRHRMAHKAAARLAKDLVEGYLSFPYSFHLRKSTSEMVRNAQQTVEQLALQSFLPAIQLIGEAIVIAGLVSVLLVFAPMATGVAIAVVGGTAWLLLIVVQPRLRRLGAVAQQERKTSLGILQQALHAVRDIKVLGKESYFVRLYDASRQCLAHSLYIQGSLGEVPRHLIELALMMSVLLVFVIATATGIGGSSILAILGLFAYVGLRMMPSLQKVVGALNSIRYSSQPLSNVYDDIREIRAHAAPLSGGELPFLDELRLEGVSFTYQGSAQPAVSGLNLVIHPGEMVGICGPTGGGKSTVADLMAGLLVPTVGRVTVDGMDIQMRLTSWYEKLGLVSQAAILVDSSIRENIALGVEGEEIDERAIQKALRLSQLQEFARALPDGLNTQVGERGVRLSGGERQRVAIARAIYRNPSVLILDEGTSALDNATEADLISALESLRGHLTIVMIAHRLSTLQNCDRIVFVSDGRLEGVGDYSTLLRRSLKFRSLVRGRGAGSGADVAE